MTLQKAPIEMFVDERDGEERTYARADPAKGRYKYAPKSGDDVATSPMVSPRPPANDTSPISSLSCCHRTQALHNISRLFSSDTRSSIPVPCA